MKNEGKGYSPDSNCHVHCSVCSTYIASFLCGIRKTSHCLEGSMVPVMLLGDMIVKKSKDPNELKVGDVIAFHPLGSEHDILITQRIISIEEGEKHLLQKKGDINYAQDYLKCLHQVL
jgi:signal peptidase I